MRKAIFIQGLYCYAPLEHLRLALKRFMSFANKVVSYFILVEHCIQISHCKTDKLEFIEKTQQCFVKNLFVQSFQNLAKVSDVPFYIL